MVTDKVFILYDGGVVGVYRTKKALIRGIVDFIADLGYGIDDSLDVFDMLNRIRENYGVDLHFDIESYYE